MVYHLNKNIPTIQVRSSLCLSYNNCNVVTFKLCDSCTQHQLNDKYVYIYTFIYIFYKCKCMQHIEHILQLRISVLNDYSNDYNCTAFICYENSLKAIYFIKIEIRIIYLSRC